MILYNNRSHPDLITQLQSLLTIDGVNGLLNTATRLNAPFTSDGQLYDKAICIDFHGLAATALFGRGLGITSYCFFEQLDTLAEHAAALNKQGVIIKIRVLFLYPYSSSGQARIQAEMNTRRASIKEPHFHRGESMDKIFMEQITEDSFKGSSLVTTLHRVITVIEEWRDKLGPDHPFLAYPNRLDARFSCLHPAGWGLRINEHFFFDIYPMAKMDRFEFRCQNAELPLIEITASDDSKAYKVYCDHFRYLWDHDATIDYRDAIQTDEQTQSLRLLPPQKVTFENTAKRVLYFQQRADNPESLYNYKKMARTILERFCPPFLPWRAKEIVFIACSWRGDPSHPISEADALKKFLMRDFKAENPPTPFGSPQIDISMIFTSPGNELYKTINTALNEATIGVAFLSPEVPFGQQNGRETYIARPNVYCELGHLLGRLPSERIILFIESSVQPPSNLVNLVHSRYETGKIQVKYLELLVTFFDINLFPSRTSFEEIVKRHMQQLQKDLQKGNINHEDYQWARDYLINKANIKID
jgi:Predicted nucleotide-binding protein containing TIR-like domain